MSKYFSLKKASAHLQYACLICAFVKLIAQKLWKELIIQTWHPIVAYSRNIYKFERAVNLSKILFSFQKGRVHIYSMPAISVPRFRLIAQKLDEKMMIQTFMCDR